MNSETLTNKDLRHVIQAIKTRLPQIDSEVKDLKKAGINGLSVGMLLVEKQHLSNFIEKLEGCEEVVIHTKN